MNVTDHCRYCGSTTEDPTAAGPDDVAPGVCPTCLDERMAPLMLAALVRSSDENADTLKAARRRRFGKARVECPAGRPHTSKTGCTNCLPYALAWRADVLARLETSGPLFGAAV